MGTEHKPKSTRARRGRSVRSFPRSQTKPTSRPEGVPPRSKPAPGLPDLDAILDAFSEALDLIQAAHMAQKQTNHWGPPEAVMSVGLAKLDRVYNDFDRATIDLASFCRQLDKTARGRL